MKAEMQEKHLFLKADLGFTPADGTSSRKYVLSENTMRDVTEKKR